ncbi:shikimate dehydrogenase [Peribacillus sp. SCS-155]|uniref:shikimate dehydrogenase n=1 Tax=Peribacillus sedimenti TaxID=3115297 RepID=UPI003905EC5A
MIKVYGVIGDPISHSVSPDIHNDAFSRYNLNSFYHHFHVTPTKLEDAVKGMKAIGVRGFNVTIPHKTAIIPHLDEVDETARAIGAVNTVVNRNGRFVGYNTDGFGYLLALKEEYNQSLDDKRILLIGAGGAARGIYCTLVKEGIANVDIANRTVEKAKELVNDCPYENHTRVFSIHEAETNLNQYDILINTTPEGMSPHTERMPLQLHKLKNDAFVSDIIYNPLKTKLLEAAEQKQAMIQNGLGMFAFQAALAFEIWTGIFPEVERMKQIVLNKLGGTEC